MASKRALIVDSLFILNAISVAALSVCWNDAFRKIFGFDHWSENKNCKLESDMYGWRFLRFFPMEHHNLGCHFIGLQMTKMLLRSVVNARTLLALKSTNPKRGPQAWGPGGPGEDPTIPRAPLYMAGSEAVTMLSYKVSQLL